LREIYVRPAGVVYAGGVGGLNEIVPVGENAGGGQLVNTSVIIGRACVGSSVKIAVLALDADKGELLWSAGHHEPALQMLKQLEEAEPDFISPHVYLRLAYFETGDYPNYLVELKKNALLTHDAAQSAVVQAAAKGFARGGEHGLFEAQISEQKKLYEQNKLSPYHLAQTETRLGNKREAIRYLTICVQSHDEVVLNLMDDQVFVSLHGDPAFRQLLAKIGLPPVS
jgi:tetratricopeptide (TPR) repeat protein